MSGEFEPIPRKTEEIGRAVLDAALTMHKALGPGLLESTYEICLAHEIERRGLSVARQVALPVVYDTVKLDA